MATLAKNECQHQFSVLLSKKGGRVFTQAGKY